MMFEQINVGQLRALVSAFLKISTRGQSGGSAVSRAATFILSYGVSAAYLGLSIATPFYETGYVLITVSVTMYLALFTALSSYSMILLDSVERTVLAPYPIAPSTLFAARMANMILHAVLIAFPFAMPLAAVYYARSGMLLAALAYAGVLLAASVWTTACFIVLYSLLVARVLHSTRLLSAAQMLLVFLLLFFYQRLPAFTIPGMRAFVDLVQPWGAAAPPMWFVAAHGLVTGELLLPSQLGLAIILIVSTVALALLTTTSWMRLPDLGWSADELRPRPPAPRGLRALASVLIPRRRALRSGFDLFRILVSREKSLRLQILPVFFMPIAIAVYGLLTGQLGNPFHGQLLDAGAKMHIPTMVFFLFSTRHLEQTLLRAISPATLWLFRLTPKRMIDGYAKGVLRAAHLVVLVPQAAALFLLFVMAMPPLEALLQALFLLAAGRTQTAIFHTVRPKVPFTRQEHHLATMQRFGQFFLLVPYFIAVMLLHLVASRTLGPFVAVVLGMEALTVLCLHRSRADAYVIAEAA